MCLFQKLTNTHQGPHKTAKRFCRVCRRGYSRTHCMKQYLTLALRMCWEIAWVCAYYWTTNVHHMNEEQTGLYALSTFAYYCTDINSHIIDFGIPSSRIRDLRLSRQVHWILAKVLYEWNWGPQALHPDAHFSDSALAGATYVKFSDELYLEHQCHG